MKDQKKILKIPVSGSLGLLALGHRGVTAWRKVRDDDQKNQESKTTREADNE